MNVAVFNLFLALAWALLRGSFTAVTLAEGFLVGYVALRMARPIYESSSYFRKLRQLAGFILFFLKELTIASLRVAYDIITPNYRFRPAVIAVPLDVQSDAEITLLANLITLTPGTLTLDVSDDRRVIYVHAMHVNDVQEFRREIKEGFERRVYELLR